MSGEARQAPMVNGSQVVAAGLASTMAALVTSRFGVAGTILGAALTTMIITGGAAILKAYLESVTGRVRKVPNKVRARREQRKAERYAEPETLPERPDLRNNLAGRMRSALGWFSHLPPLARRSILVKGLIAAAVAFLIGMGAVWGVERIINNSLSCGFWGNCPQGAAPGIHFNDREGAGSTLTFGRARTQAAPGYGGQDPSYQQNGLQQNPLRQDGSFRQGTPDYQRPSPRDSDARPGGGLFEPDRPAEPAEREAPVQPGTPSSASPAPEQPAPGGVEEQPEIRPQQDASPPPAQ
ncbi:MAG TPA: hypothetical protein VK276_08385 [Rubrobacteraceae bacterium]|nr:hypothetical protein [Rubrobacteraceae bacterium]